MGANFEAEDALAKLAIMDDILHDAQAAHEDAYERLHPDLNRLAHWSAVSAGTQVAALEGRTIKAARSLNTGHFALELGDGRVLVFCAEDDVKVATGDSMEFVVAEDFKMPGGTYYTDAPTADDKEHGEARCQQGMMEALGAV